MNTTQPRADRMPTKSPIADDVRAWLERRVLVLGGKSQAAEALGLSYDTIDRALDGYALTMRTRKRIEVAHAEWLDEGEVSSRGEDLEDEDDLDADDADDADDDTDDDADDDADSGSAPASSKSHEQWRAVHWKSVQGHTVLAEVVARCAEHVELPPEQILRPVYDSTGARSFAMWLATQLDCPRARIAWAFGVTSSAVGHAVRKEGAKLEASSHRNYWRHVADAMAVDIWLPATHDDRAEQLGRPQVDEAERRALEAVTPAPASELAAPVEPPSDEPPPTTRSSEHPAVGSGPRSEARATQTVSWGDVVGAVQSPERVLHMLAVGIDFMVHLQGACMAARELLRDQIDASRGRP